jgi:pyridoxal phosphate enzyme (YggS family)
MVQTSSIAENYTRVCERIAGAAARAGRRPEDITLVGISKTHPAEAVVEAIRAGLHHVGENRVQEAAPKFFRVRQALGPNEQVVLHLVGHLQTNKAADAASLFDRVDSVDSVKVAQALSRRVGSGRVLPILVEVYVGEDPERPGLRPYGLVETVGAIAEVPNLRVEGLMSIAPLGVDPGNAFAQVRALKVTLAQALPRVHFGVLSMGMSEDFHIAIEHGSTEVRLGTALFGPRASRQL